MCVCVCVCVCVYLCVSSIKLGTINHLSGWCNNGVGGIIIKICFFDREKLFSAQTKAIPKLTNFQKFHCTEN